MLYSLHFGCRAKTIELPDHLAVDVLTPGAAAPLEDPAGVLRRLLADCPAARFETTAQPRKIAVAVPDETRPFPLAELLPVLLEHLAARWPDLPPEAVTVHVGGGLHPPMDRAGLDRLVPPNIRHGAGVLAHDARNAPLADLGRTSRGTPVHVNEAYARADLRIVMGQVDPHQFTGFSGGSKGVCIGLGGPETIRANHSLMTRPGARPGTLHGNPVREDLNEAGDLAGIHLAVNVVNGPDKRPVWIGAGAHREVLEAGSRVCAEIYGVAIDEPYDMVVASCGGHPKDICLYQAQKGLFNAALAAAPGGRVLLLAACPQGVGDRAYEEYAARFSCLRDMAEDFQSHEFRVGPHKGYLFSLSALDREVVLDCALDDATLSRCHLTPGDAQETILRWSAGLPAGARVAVVPYANTTFFHRDGCAPDARRRATIQRRHTMIQFLVHEKADTVGVATVDIKAGETAVGLFMDSQDKIEIEALQDIPLGHKLALSPMKAGDTVLKYGHDIGEVTADFETGAHVHVHNLKTKRW